MRLIRLKNFRFLLFFSLLLLIYPVNFQAKSFENNLNNISTHIFQPFTIDCITFSSQNKHNTTDTSRVYIKGQILNKITKKGVLHASIKFFDSKNKIAGVSTTDENGKFRIQITKGEYYKIEIFASDYQNYRGKFQVLNQSQEYFDNVSYNAYITPKEIKNSDNHPDISSPAILPPTPKNDSLVTISGKLKDSLFLEPIIMARVRLLEITNNKSVKTTQPDEDGNFIFKTLPGNYTIEVKTTDFKTFSKNITLTSPINLGTIHLSPNESYKSIKEVIITAQKSKILIKGDTIQYDVGAYNIREGALLKDAIKKIPGLSINKDGMLIANGQVVSKITINGKEFFDNDIQMALKNLPVTIINKLELYKQPSDISKITGFKDGNDEQVLNLKIKDEFKNSMFGDILGGYGSDDRYLYKGMVNYLGEKNQVSLLANANNINGDVDDEQSFAEGEGITTSKTIGVNGNHENNHVKIDGNMRYSEDSNKLQILDNTEYFLPEEKRFSTSESSDHKDTKTGAFGFNLSMEPKSIFSLYFRLTGEHEEIDTKNTNHVISSSNLFGITKEKFDLNTNSKNNDIKSLLTLGLKLNKEGNRSLSLSVNGQYNKEESNGYQKSFTTYEANNTEVDLDQKLLTEDKTTRTGFELSYTEPFNSKNSLLLSYSYQRTDINKYNKVYNKDLFKNYSVIDSTYTREYDTYYNNHTLNMSFQSIQDKYQYTVGVSAEPVSSKKRIFIGDYTIQNINQNNLNYSSNIRLQYKPSKNKIFNFNYNGTLIRPNVDQLTSDTTTLSTTNKIYGNPDLKSTLNNNFNFLFQKNNVNTGRYFSILGNLHYIVNQVVNYTILDKLGNSTTTYQNVTGSWGTNLGVIFNTPIRNSDFSLDLNINGSYYRQLGFMNEEKNVTNNYTINSDLGIGYDHDFINSRIQLTYSYNTTQNNQLSQNNLETSNYGINNSTQIELPWGIDWYNFLSYTYRSGYNSDIRKDELLWNISLTKKIFKKNKGEIKLQFYDILKNRNNIIRSVNSNYISDIRSNVISSYFMLSFKYRFNFMK